MVDFALFARSRVPNEAIVHTSTILSVVTLAWIDRFLADLLVLPSGVQANMSTRQMFMNCDNKLSCERNGHDTTRKTSKLDRMRMHRCDLLDRLQTYRTVSSMAGLVGCFLFSKLCNADRVSGCQCSH